MLFNSLEFMIFFPIVCLLYFLLPHKYRWLLLLIASCIFYMAFIPKYILIILGINLLDYVTGILLEKTSGKTKTFILWCSLILSFLPLLVFKYFNFFTANVVRFAALFNLHYSVPILKLILPIGLSFHTFQSFGYCIEVYKGRLKAERRLGIFLLFGTFFPQLMAGPIERAQNLLPQFDEVHKFDFARLNSGLRRMLWGFFKKMVVADQLSVIVSKIYGNPSAYPGLPLIIATLAFAVQIYCDFSGYTDIAIGAARILGFKLMENFETPYFSKSVPEFWRRWHISLFNWFRNYIYFPLGGSRCSMPRHLFNLMVVFAVSGLWHGANWTFIIWGVLNGIYLISSILTAKIRGKIVAFIRLDRLPALHAKIETLIAFTLITLSWVFFRASNIHQALYIFRHLIPASFSLSALRISLGATDLYEELILSMFAVAILLFVEVCISKRNIFFRTFASRPWIRTACYLALFVIILGLGVSSSEAQFIYFQF